MKNINLLFIAPLPPPITGQAVACEALHIHLKSLGYKIDFINLSKNEFKQGVSSFKRCIQIFKILIEIFKIKKKANVIYMTPAESVAGNLKDILIYVLCYFQLKNMIIHLHGGAGMRNILSEKHPFLNAVNRFFLKKIGGVIVLGERLKSIYSDVIDQSKLHAVKNFADDEWFVDDSYVDKKFSKLNPLRILFLSNLLPGKGHEELLSALSLLSANEQKLVRIDFAGGFESLAAEEFFRHNVAKNEMMKINVHGTVRGVLKKDLLRDSHLFCLPTYYPYEGQPISILEAYASGCAVVTTNHSGIFDIFSPGVNGFEVKKRSPESIAAVIKISLEKPEMIISFSKFNLAQAKNKYRSMKHVNSIEKIISSVANK